MKIALINACINGSTGHIMCNVADIAHQQGHDTYTFSKAWIDQNYDGLVNHKEIGNYFLNRVHIKLALYTGLHGCYSILPTIRLISQLKKINPDVIHLHNIHGWFINIPLLFRYIKARHIRVIWTLHDCWAFTGHCPHFTLCTCDKWKTGCHNCTQYTDYPASLVDRSRFLYNMKKKNFCKVPDLTIVTPSQWLKGLVKQSYLKDYPVEVINNGIDLSIFKPTESDFREKYDCKDKIILLGVAFDWGKRKGLDVFVELARRLDENYQIVLVGTNDDIDKQLPQNIISIHHTNSQVELAKIYTAADLFINPTREENYPTVNMETLACGTPIITFNTGGSPEILDESCGCVVDCDDINSLKKQIMRCCSDKPFSIDSCLARAQSFDMNDAFNKYIALYDKSQEKWNHQ